MAFSLRRHGWLAIVPALVAAYALFGFVGVPRIAAEQIRRYTAQQLHRPATVGAISFNPFTLDATVRDLSIPDADGKPMLAFARLHVRFGLFASIARRGGVVTVVELDELAAHAIRRADKSINLAALVPKQEPEPPPAPLPRLFVDSFSLRDASLAVDDEARTQALHLSFKPVSFELKDFQTKSESNAYGFAAKSTRGESLEWRGTFGLEPLVESQGSFTISRLQATTISQAGGDLMPLDISRGTIDVQGGYRLSVRDPLELKLDIASVRVHDLGLREHLGSEDWVVVPELAVDGTKLDLAAQTLEVAAVTVDHASVHAWRERDGSFNLARLYSVKAAGSAAAPTDKIDRPWRVSVPVASVRTLDARVEDRSLQSPVQARLSPVNLTVRGLAVPLVKPLDIDLDATVDGRGHLKATGPVGVEPLTARLAVAVDDLDLPVVQPYLDQFTQLNVLSGEMSARLSVDYGVAPAAKGVPIKVAGDVSVKSLHTQDKILRQDFVNWSLLAVKGIEVTTAPFALSIREVLAHQPYARIVIAADQTTNIGDVLGAPKATGGTGGTKPVADTGGPAAGKSRGAKAAAHPAPKPVDTPIAVHLVKIDDGALNFTDLSVRPNFATGIESLSGTIRGLAGRSGTKADIDLKGRVDRYAPVTIAGTTNPLAAQTSTDIRFTIRNLELTTFSPYSGKFAGYRVEKGKMSVDFEYHIKDRLLDAKHHLILDQLELGEKVDSPDATGLPVKFALSLLKDVNGVIDLDLPVNGSLDDPKFRLAPIIWKVFVNILEKAVTAPFRLLGSLFGGGNPPEMISFVPGSAELDDSAKSQIDTLKKGLAARPALKLDVPMAACADADSAALGQNAWSAHVHELARAQLSGGRKGAKPAGDDAVEALLGDQKSYRMLLESDYRATRGPMPKLAAAGPDQDADDVAVAWLEAALKPAAVLPPHAVEALARARAEGVERALLDQSGIDPARVFIVTDKGTDCGDPAFVQLKLALK